VVSRRSLRDLLDHRKGLLDQRKGVLQRRAVVAALSLLLLVPVALVITRPWSDTQTIQVPPAQRGDREQRAAWAADALRRLEDAVRTDASAGLSPLGAVIADNAQALRVGDFSLRYVVEDEGAQTGGSSEWVADVTASWRFAGFDRAAATTEVSVTFRQDGEAAVIEAVGGHGRRSPLWLTGPVQVRRTADTLVVGATGVDVDRYSSLARRAVPVVRRVLTDWRAGLVIEVAASARGLDEELDAQSGEYAQIAAVTTTPDGSTARQAPVHVFVNPEVFGDLLPQGAQVVMSHEASHVATRAVHASMPLWLVEGFADYVALRDVDLPLTKTAAQIAELVRRDGPPQHLPTDAEFDTRTTHLGASYEAAWLACRTLADLGGERRLVKFYRAVSAGGAVDEELQQVFGFSEHSFTKTWRQRLQDLVG